MTELQQILSSNMKQARKRFKLSQTGLAEKAGTAPNYISQIECGQRFPSPQMIERIALALNLESYELFCPKMTDQISLHDVQNIVRDYVDQALTEAFKKI